MAAMFAAEAMRMSGLALVRFGLLTESAQFPPEVHIFTKAKQRRAILPAGVATFAKYCDSSTLRPADVAARVSALLRSS